MNHNVDTSFATHARTRGPADAVCPHIPRANIDIAVNSDKSSEPKEDTFKACNAQSVKARVVFVNDATSRNCARVANGGGEGDALSTPKCIQYYFDRTW